MGTAAAQCPFSTSAHFHGNSRVLHPKVDFSSFNFSANGEISRLNLYPSSASSGTSKVIQLRKGCSGIGLARVLPSQPSSLTARETMKRVKELVQFGGFLDTGYLQRTLAKEFQQMESCFKQAFEVPFTTISKKILFEDLLRLFPVASSRKSASLSFPTSVSYYQETSEAVTTYKTHEQRLVDYISFRIPDDSFSNIRNCIGIARGFMHNLSSVKKGNASLEAVLLSVPDGYHCVDLYLYKESQIVLLLNESTTSSESSSNGCMMIVQASDLPFVSISRSTGLNRWNLHELKMENEKVRNIPHFVVAPLAVSVTL